MKSYNTHEIKFKTETEYDVLKEFPSNLEFNLPSWQTESKESTDIVIFINGFLEGTEKETEKRKKRIAFYDRFAQDLLSKKVFKDGKLKTDGIASVLLPLPFHFDRCNDFNSSENAAPVERLLEHGSYLYLGGFTQVVNDMNVLLEMITNQPNLFGLNKNKKANIHIVGYSLGGVAAIGSCLRLGKKYNIKSLSVLLSSWNLSQIDPNSIEQSFKQEHDFGSNEWNKMLEELKEITTDEIWDALIWGEGELPVLDGVVENVLFIHGLQDHIFKKEISQDLSSKILKSMNNEKYTFILMPSDHTARRVMPLITGYVNSFIARR